MRARLALRAPLDVVVRVVGDQAARQADALHHVVAGVDAERAIDAFELIAVADVDAHRAGGDALVAVDAMAAAFPRLALLVRAARLAAIGAIGDHQRVVVDQRRLDARPRAHIGAHLLAHVAGEPVGREA